MPSNAHGDFPPDTLQEHRASSHATAEPSFWPPHQLSATEHTRMRGRRKEESKGTWQLAPTLNMSLAASRKWLARRYSSTTSRILFFSRRCEAYLDKRGLISFMLWAWVSSSALFHWKKQTSIPHCLWPRRQERGRQMWRTSVSACLLLGIFSLSHLIQVDTSVDCSFGLVALEEGLHSLLTHAHVGEVLAQFLRRRTMMSSEGDEAALMDRRGGLLAAGCDSPAAHWSASRDPRSPPACSNTPPTSPGSGLSGSTGLHWPLGRKRFSYNLKGLWKSHLVFNVLNNIMENHCLVTRKSPFNTSILY